MSSAFRTLKELHDQEHETEDDERSLRSLYYSAQEGTLSSRTSSLNTLHFVKEEEDDGEDGEDDEVTTVPSLERIPSVPSLGELSLSEGDMDFSKKQECAYREEEETSGLIEAAGAVEQVSSEPSSPAPLALAPHEEPRRLLSEAESLVIEAGDGCGRGDEQLSSGCHVRDDPRIDDLESQVADLEARVADLETQLGAAREGRDANQALIETLRRDAAAQQGLLDTKEVDIAALQGTIVETSCKPT